MVEAVGYTAEVAAPPGRDGEAGSAAADDASVRIDPTRRGAQAMTLHILTAAGAPVPARTVTAPLPGVWTLTLDVALGPADAYATSASYRVW